MNLHDGVWKKCKAGKVPILGIWRHGKHSSCWLRLPNAEVKLAYDVVGVCVQQGSGYEDSDVSICGCGANSSVEIYIGEK